MRTAAAAFRCTSQQGGNSVQTGVVWGAVGGGYDWAPMLPNATKKRAKKSQRKERSL